MTNDGDLATWWTSLLAEADDSKAAVEHAYQRLENAGLIARVVVHRYICRKRGCRLATVVRVQDRLIVRTEPYKFGPGLNEARSVPRARERNTLDGDRYWPGHTFDVFDLAGWGDQAGMDMNCRHGTRTIFANTIVETVGDARPGHPGAPSRI